MTPDLLAALKADRRRVRSEVALHAGRVLVLEPEQFSSMTVLDVLQRIPYLSLARADQLSRAAGVYPLRLGADLKDAQRAALAHQLATFANLFPVGAMRPIGADTAGAGRPQRPPAPATLSRATAA